MKNAIDIINKLNKFGKAYIVGGAVRDEKLGHKPHDIDIATDVPMDTICEIFKDNAHDTGKNKDFGIVVVNIDGNDYEIAHFRKDDDYDDGRRPNSVDLDATIEDDLNQNFTGIELSDWIVVDEYCATRVYKNSDPNVVGNRVAFIEKTARVRKEMYDHSREESVDCYKWEYGNKYQTGHGNHEEEGNYGFDVESREWCDNRLKELGYEL